MNISKYLDEYSQLDVNQLLADVRKITGEDYAVLRLDFSQHGTESIPKVCVSTYSPSTGWTSESETIQSALERLSEKSGPANYRAKAAALKAEAAALEKQAAECEAAQ